VFQPAGLGAGLGEPKATVGAVLSMRMLSWFGQAAVTLLQIGTCSTLPAASWLQKTTL